ncbi:MAG TPA: nucleotidyltransferase family protein [Terriglobales bacterium]
MKAMILAAGLGTRLRPLTNDRPKALVEVHGRTLLEITLSRLREFGIRDIIINAHHFADRIIEYLQSNHNFGLRIEVSREDVLLDTGGGLKKAAHFFLGDSAPEPFLLHNVDVISAIDLARMLRFHTQRKPLATLAVQHRHSSRRLLFNSSQQLCGRYSGDSGAELAVADCEANLAPLAFCGIHIISPRLLAMITEQGAFSIIDTYLRLATAGEKILGFRADDYYWRDLGKPENLTQAEEDAKAGRVSV